MRRAWIDTALDSVRSHLESSDDDPGLAPDVFDVPEEAEASAHDSVQQEAAPASSGGRPKLYVAWSADDRAAS